MVWEIGYVLWCVTQCATGSVVYSAAMMCAVMSAIMSVRGSLDKASFACLYREIYVKFSVIYIIICFVKNTISFFLNLTVVIEGQKS